MSDIPTRYQVYELRDAQNNTVYVGIAGGTEHPRDATDRLREHLYTKTGEFIGDADTLYIHGVDLDERIARALEDDLIDSKSPKWNRRQRDPQSYARKYGTKPTPDEVRAANNALLRFKIEVLP
jgi:excinuclease UvrABC nuclease subunit